MTISTNPVPSSVSGGAALSRRWRDIGLLVGLIVLVVAGLVALALATGWEETLAGLKNLNVAQISILLVLSLVNYGFRGLRWHLFAGRLGLPTKLVANVRQFIGGFAMSVTPGRVGELVRMRWIRRETGWPFDKTAPLVLVDRSADLAAMAILLALALAFSTTGIAGGAPVVMLALIAAYIATRPELMRTAANLGHSLTGKRLPKLFARIRRAAMSLKAFQGPTTLMAAGALGVIGWMAEGWAFHLLLVWMGAQIDLWMALAIFIFATMAGGLTGAPGGLGGAEAAMVGLLALQGVPLEIAVPATLIIRLTTLWFAIGLGLLVFPWAERQSQKASHGLENN
ncbi:MAG: flippase-like domain-containing protein [Boseongicola sp.]|nr:MAG: flippase-like domain-containing protein [Boseongicola sp.]